MHELLFKSTRPRHGASSGLGAAFAEELARRGCSRLTLVARDTDRLKAMADKLAATKSLEVRTIAQDLCDPGSVARVAHVASGFGEVDILINNAGFGSCGRFEEQSLETQLAEVQLNVAAVMGLTHALLPGMRARRSGGILNVASTAAFQPFAYMATYAATKSFVLSLSEALWAKNRRSGVHVTAICPGPTDTRFFERMGTDLPAFLGKYGPPLPVVCDGLDALAIGLSSKVSGAKNFMMTQAPRLLPRQAVVSMGEKAMASKEHTATASSAHAANAQALKPQRTRAAGPPSDRRVR